MALHHGAMGWSVCVIVVFPDHALLTYFSRHSSIKRWKVAGLFGKPKVIYCIKQSLDGPTVNAVLHLCDSSMFT